MESRSVTFQLSELQAAAAAKQVLRRRLKVPLWPVLAIGAPLAIVGLLLPGEGAIGASIPILSWLVLILCFILGTVHYWLLPRQARRHFRQTSLLSEAMTLSWDEDGFSLAGDRASSRLAWRDLYAWDENDDIVLLMQSEMLYNLVPKSALTNEQTEDLKKCLKTAELRML